MRQYYVYIYTDPSDNQPFYIGKGYGLRAYQHLKRSDHHPMTYKLRRLKQDGVEPVINIINRATEHSALELEKQLIQKYGRKDLDKGPLLNMTDGGEGSAGAVRSASAKTKHSVSMVKYWAQQEVKENEAIKAYWNRRRSSLFSSMKRNAAAR